MKRLNRYFYLYLFMSNICTLLTRTRLLFSNINISSREINPSPFVSKTSKQNFFFSVKSPLRNTDRPLTHSSKLTYPSLSWSNALNTASIYFVYVKYTYAFCAYVFKYCSANLVLEIPIAP